MTEIIAPTPDTPEEPGTRKPDNSQKNPKWWHPGWWLGLGVPLFIIAVIGLFIACRYYVGHPNDTPAFVAGVIGLLTLAAIISQAVIYKRQSDLMREGLDKTQSLIRQNERIVAQMSLQEGHMLTQLRQNKEQFSINNRPVIIVTSAVLKSAINTKRPPVAAVKMKNTGGNIANDVHLTFNRALIGDAALEQIRKGGLPTGGRRSRVNKGIIGSNGVIDFQTETFPEPVQWNDGVLVKLLQDEYIFYVWGDVKYTDLSDDTTYITFFCLYAGDKDSLDLAYSPNWNKIGIMGKPDPSSVFRRLKVGTPTSGKDDDPNNQG